MHGHLNIKKVSHYTDSAVQVTIMMYRITEM